MLRDSQQTRIAGHGGRYALTGQRSLSFQLCLLACRDCSGNRKQKISRLTRWSNLGVGVLVPAITYLESTVKGITEAGYSVRIF